MTTTSRVRGITTAVVFGAALLAGIAGCSSGQGIAYNPPAVDNPIASSTPPVARVMGATVADAVPLGTKLSSTKSDITVHAVQIYTPSQYSSTKPGIAIDVEVTSTTPGTPTTTGTNNPLTVSASYFDAVDAVGHIYPATLGADRTPAFPGFANVYSGEVTRGWIVIETPLAAADLVIRAQLTNGHYYWKP